MQSEEVYLSHFLFNKHANLCGPMENFAVHLLGVCIFFHNAWGTKIHGGCDTLFWLYGNYPHTVSPPSEHAEVTSTLAASTLPLSAFIRWSYACCACKSWCKSWRALFLRTRPPALICNTWLCVLNVWCIEQVPPCSVYKKHKARFSLAVRIVAHRNVQKWRRPGWPRSGLFFI